MITSNPKIVVIVGPTASGKSDLAIKIAQKFNGEIISADSRQVYRGMDVGTGKVPRDRIKFPSFAEASAGRQVSSFKFQESYFSNGVRHHLLDVASPKRQFTVARFKKLGQKAIKEILADNKIPIIIGGAGFYIDVLLDRMPISEVQPNKKLRIKLEKKSEEQLYSKLLSMDYERAQEIDPKNKRRLIRALEITLSTGRPAPKLVLSTKYQVLWLGIKPKDLNRKIKKRLDKRLEQGMVKEIKNLRNQGVSWKRLDELGLEYRWVSRYLKHSKFQIQDSKFKDSDEYQNLLRDIIKYSKRQMTWFKRNPEIKWLSTDTRSDLVSVNLKSL
mgnify:CR=1 FL=1